MIERGRFNATRCITLASVVTLVLAACTGGDRGSDDTTQADVASGDTLAACPADNGGITLPAGFCATVFADTVGHARHMAIAPNGTVYVNTWSGRYYGNAPPPRGGFIVALRDTTGDGVADVRARFGDSVQSGGIGGTGIALYRGALFVEANDKILRYELPSGGNDADGRAHGRRQPASTERRPSAAPVRDRFRRGDVRQLRLGDECLRHQGSDARVARPRSVHRAAHARGHLALRRQPHRPDVLTGRAVRDRDSQRHRHDHRRATARSTPRSMAATSSRRTGPSSTRRSRDRTFPPKSSCWSSRARDFGWPYCYYDDTKRQLVLAPEYGGNGTEVGRCASMRAPIATFPAHWAPNGVVFYESDRFPAKYRGGAFIAFHGSWNRAPGPQGGYNVVFVTPSGTPPGQHEVFADGFAGAGEITGSRRPPSHGSCRGTGRSALH